MRISPVLIAASFALVAPVLADPPTTESVQAQPQSPAPTVTQPQPDTEYSFHSPSTTTKPTHAAPHKGKHATKHAAPTKPTKHHANDSHTPQHTAALGTPDAVKTTPGASSHAAPKHTAKSHHKSVPHRTTPHAAPAPTSRI